MAEVNPEEPLFGEEIARSNMALEAARGAVRAGKTVLAVISPFDVVEPEVAFALAAGIVLAESVVEHPPRLDKMVKDISKGDVRLAAHGMVVYTTRTIFTGCLAERTPKPIKGVVSGAGDRVIGLSCWLLNPTRE